MLDAEQQRQVVDRVFENLYTPVGLRSLEKSDPEFHPHYGGSTLERDLAYHQGTVWGFPLGGYYLAYLRAERNSSEAIGTVRHQLRGIEAALREGCVGQLAEIYDGARPTVSRGCFAQAWSVGEILKVYAELDRLTNTGSEGTTADIGPEAKVIGSVPEVPSTT
jgi:glycogen debranching enzyme